MYLTTPYVKGPGAPASANEIVVDEPPGARP